MATLNRGDFPTATQNGLQFLVDLVAELADLRNKHNTHVHVENTAGSYTQNASTAAPAGVNQATGVTDVAGDLVVEPEGNTGG